MITFTQQSLLDELVQTLHILFVHNFGENSERVRLDHLIFGLLYVFGEARDNNKNFIFVHLELLDEHVDESTQILVLLGTHLEQFCHIKKHTTLL